MTRCSTWIAVISLLAFGGRGHAQELADRGPRFLVASASQLVPVDVSRTPLLGRRISLDLDGATVKEALAQITQQSGLRLVYGDDLLPTTARVQLRAEGITVAAALTDVLLDAGLDVVFSLNGRAALVRRSAVGGLVEAGAVAGRVTEAQTERGVAGVRVFLDGTRWRTTTDSAGDYRLTEVTPGAYTLMARRIGYKPFSQLVRVEGETEATINFALETAPSELAAVVVTATGEQRRYQVGNVISRINVDSITPTAPVTSVTDVLTARVPGLQVVETGGLTGSGEALRLRGLSSIALQSDPIVIVDGVRQDNSPGGSYINFFSNLTATPPRGAAASATPSRLNDIDVSQIATIDVLKGPAAATEYGTDAANGVIVITTKRGTSGAPQWHASVEAGANDIPTGFPDYYYSWGHTTDGSRTAVQCPLVTYYFSPQSTNGTCVVDSVTHYNPLNHSATSIYGVGTRAKTNLDVSGGTETIRYYLAGGLTTETGALRVPPVFLSQARAFGFPSATLEPNGEQQRSGRANMFIRVGSTADLTVSAAYLSTVQTTTPLGGQGLFSGSLLGSSPDSANNYGWGAGPLYTPLSSLGTVESQRTNRFTGGVSANWRPAFWFAAFADAGIDHGSELHETTFFPQVGLYEGLGPNGGNYGLSQVSTDVYSGDVRGAATAGLTRGVRALTTVGLNFRDTRTSGLASFTSGLTATNLTLVGARFPAVTQSGNRSATLGGYVEEQIQIADRLFLTGALRIDAASGFGHSYRRATYPKAGASWLAVQDGLTTVRLRGAFGAAAVPPYNGLSLQLYTPVAVLTNGGNAVQLSQPGNPGLRPERSAEWEGGVDVGLWGNRVSLELSGYSKTTQDALYAQTLGWDLGGYGHEINIGEIRNSGAEGRITAIPVRSPSLTWDVTLSGSINHNRLVHLAPGLSPLVFNSGAQRIVPGYPLYGFWGNRERYADANRDGILEPNEVTVDTASVYLGSSIPTQQASFDTHVTVWRGTLSLGALLTYQGGYKVFNSLAETGANYGTLPENNVPGSPLWKQARSVAYTTITTYYAGYTNPEGLFEDGTVLRFQELSLTWALPPRWAQAVRIHNLSLTAAVRNLAYWTRYSGGDPSASNSGGLNYQPSGNIYTVNNDIRASGASAVPLAQYYQFRLNVGF